MGTTNDKDGLPRHAQVSEVPIRTPVDVRLGLAVAPARYFPRGLAKAITDPNSPEFIRKRTLEPLLKWVTPHYFDHINQRLATIPAQDILRVVQPGGAGSEAITKADKILEALETDTQRWSSLFKDVANIQRPWGAGSSDLVSNTIKHAFSDYGTALNKGATSPVLALTDKSRAQKLTSPMTNILFEMGYDNMLALGGFAMTYAIRNRVMNDMVGLFSEVVGYEKDKDGSAVTKQDIFSSTNEIVQFTTANYRSKLVQRVGISAIPLLKNLQTLRALPFSDLVMGVWGAFWIFDVWGRQPTMLELLSDFVNDKLNPKFGIGDKVKPSDIINLYQQYALKFHPDWAFQGVLTSDPGENRVWAQSEQIFVRVADLMNETYNYKHSTRMDPHTGLPEESARFPLPKFIYLLGNGLINVHKPEWTMAYIEIANSYDMKAVKEVQKAQGEGATLQQVLAKYPVDLKPVLRAASPAKLSIEAPTRATPAPHVHAAESIASRLQSTPAMAQPQMG